MALPESITQGIDWLDPLPISAQKLLTAAAGEHVDFRQLVDIVEQDQALASNVLRAANSALYAGTEQIQELRVAVMRLGAGTLTDIAVGGALRSLGTDAEMFNLTEQELWLHSMAASLAAREIRETSPNEDVPWAATTAALVHDIGKLVMVRYLEADMTSLLDMCEKENMTYTEAERAVLGCDHTEVGAELARVWKFPEAMVDAIARHHDEASESSTPILDTVTVANFVCKTIGAGLGAAGLNMYLDEGCLTRLGIDYEAFSGICARTALRVEEVS